MFVKDLPFVSLLIIRHAQNKNLSAKDKGNKQGFPKAYQLQFLFIQWLPKAFLFLNDLKGLLERGFRLKSTPILAFNFYQICLQYYYIYI